MLSFLQHYRLRKTFNSYVMKLGPALVKRYGAKNQYSVMQIKKTAQHLTLDIQYLAYAIALFRHEESVNTLNIYRIDQAFLNILRREIADALFDGNTRYSSKDVLRAAKPRGWHGGKPNSWVTEQAMWYAISSR